MLECSGVQGCCSSPPPAEADEGALQKLFEAVKNPGPRKTCAEQAKCDPRKRPIAPRLLPCGRGEGPFYQLEPREAWLGQELPAAFSWACRLLLTFGSKQQISKRINITAAILLSVENVEGNSATWRKPSQVDLQNTESQVSSSSHLCVVGRSFFICWHGTTRPPKLLQVRVNGPHLCKCILSVLQPIR